MRETSSSDGYSEEADKYRKAKTEGKAWLVDLETEEKEKTGIKNLKIKYNKVFGYYFEVTNSFKDLVPDYFIRKQTPDKCGALHDRPVKRAGRHHHGRGGPPVHSGIRFVLRCAR